MVLSMILIRLAHLILSCYRAAWKIRNHGKTSPTRPPPPLPHQQPFMHPSITKWPIEGRSTKTIVCDIHGTLLRTPSFFPYFMLVAFEGGNLLRALLLLLSYPLLCVLDHEQELKVLCFITFCGLRLKDMEIVERAVLPKFYLENLNLHAYEAFASAGKRVVITSVPRVMVRWFLKEYLSVDTIIGTELQMLGCFFTGLTAPSGVVVKHKALKEAFGDIKPDVGFTSSSSLHDPFFISLCKESYMVTKSTAMPRERYPKPLIFHDGRLAFLPTPTSTLHLFLWLPLGFPLAIFRLLAGILLPYKLSIFLCTLTGMRLRLKLPPNHHQNPPTPTKKGVLYVCTHRTLLDPIFLSTALGKPLTAVTYSLSKLSEVLAPIKTVRLTRDRAIDGETMQRLLKEGDLVVCPEGTTCREPYLLRFSSLFAELTDEIVPVAVDVKVSMFYGTTASGLKWLDPIFFLMNPWSRYEVEVLEKVEKEMSCGGGGRRSCDVANYIQGLLGGVLGFECTGLTRKDKYLMLAGNEGIVKGGKD
ncbi:Glycerol-3-phosphate acyltransferase 1 [Acorus gramineus]|uniref:Glycerol-3-phosphate acyltransferase 1 n=1 Tax=Acorus gramineus TaxID=55184 RepID=A0AAV9BTI2_ACOGR|nr:Glycerol-3-phosphate acyltransferase 1 [Acorus gramineus]